MPGGGGKQDEDSNRKSRQNGIPRLRQPTLKWPPRKEMNIRKEDDNKEKGKRDQTKENEDVWIRGDKGK